MNYDEEAKKIADRFFDDQMPVTRKHLVEAISAALRLAANEAAWAGWDAHYMAVMASSRGEEEEANWHRQKLESDFGTAPEGGTR